MTIDFLHLYTRCPHCTTMFRVAVADIESTDGWVKCGRCRKAFDCRNNEVDPMEFVEADEASQDPQETDQPQMSAEKHSGRADKVQTAPQIPLFDEPADKTARQQSEAAFVSVEANETQDLEPASVNEINLKTETAPSGPESQPPGDREQSSDPQWAHAPVKLNKKLGQPIEQRTNVKQKQPRPASPRAPRTLVARVRGFKGRKNRSVSSGRLSLLLAIIALLGLLVWQMTVVNYTALANYRILSVPLKGLCMVLKCNTAAPPEDTGFEILHANLRRDANLPEVVSVSAKLINFSSRDKVLPTVRLDLTDDKNQIVASRTIDLSDNPQYVDPTISELAPGQDVKLLLNFQSPPQDTFGFELNVVDSIP